MSGERRRPWLALFLLADGLTAALAGRKAMLRLRDVAPLSFQIALDGLLELPESFLRLAGAGEALLGAILLAAYLRAAPPHQE